MQAMTSHRTRDMASTEVDRDACAGDQRLRSERRGEEVYRVSVDVLRACQGVVVETFDERALPDVDGSGRARAWSRAAARALVTLLERFRPQRILVHNYHNLLSSAILPVLARYKRHSGCGLFMTAHDYHLLFYNPSLLIYPGGARNRCRSTSCIAAGASRLRRAARCSSRCREEAALACGQRAFDPLGLFDEILCPSPFMRDLIAQCGRTRATLVPNPIDSTLIPHPPKPVRGDRLDLAFVGRVDADKPVGFSRS